MIVTKIKEWIEFEEEIDRTSGITIMGLDQVDLGSPKGPNGRPQLWSISL